MEQFFRFFVFLCKRKQITFASFCNCNASNTHIWTLVDSYDDLHQTSNRSRSLNGWKYWKFYVSKYYRNPFKSSQWFENREFLKLNQFFRYFANQHKGFENWPRLFSQSSRVQISVFKALLQNIFFFFNVNFQATLGELNCPKPSQKGQNRFTPVYTYPTLQYSLSSPISPPDAIIHKKQKKKHTRASLITHRFIFFQLRQKKTHVAHCALIRIFFAIKTQHSYTYTRVDIRTILNKYNLRYSLFPYQ